MAADWQFPLSLDDQARRLVLARARTLRAAIPKDSSSVGEVLDQFTSQVEAGEDTIRLRLGGLDLHGLVHLATVLDALAPGTGRLRCIACGGAGDLPVPRPVQALYGEFTHRYQLGLLMDDNEQRAKYLDMPADLAARKRIEAERQREAEKRAEEIRRQELASRRVLTFGDLAPGEDTYEGAERRTAPDYLPALAATGRTHNDDAS